MKMIGEIASGLVRVGDGLWRSSAASSVSYPEDGYDACFAIEERSFWFRHRNDCLLATLRNYPPPGPLFDVGGGNGFVCLHLQRNGIESILIEPGGPGVRNARSRGIRPIIHSSVEDAGFRPRSLPAIGLFDVLEHIEDDIGYLRTLQDLLAPSGRLYLTVPAHEFLWSEADGRAQHYRRYGRAELAEKLGATGFALEYSTAFFGVLLPAILVLRTVPYRIGVRMRGHVGRRVTREHGPRNRVVKGLMEWGLARELAKIAKRRSLLLGSSYLLVARAEHL